MLERVGAESGRLGELITAIRADPSAWSDWQAIYFSVPRNINPDKARECIANSADLIAHHLVDQEGLIFIPDYYAVMAVVRLNDRELLAEAGLQAADLALTQINTMPNYEIYQLVNDYGHFIDMVYNRFGLEQGSPQPWSSPSHLLRFCRDDDTSRHGIHQTLKRTTKILLVEDDPVTRWLVRNALKDECELATASSGSKAVHVYQTYQPDLVFLDIGLPDRSGYDVLDDILKQDPGARVVMFTHNSNFDTMVSAINNGAKGFVTKPFYRGRLLHYINTL